MFIIYGHVTSYQHSRPQDATFLLLMSTKNPYSFGAKSKNIFPAKTEVSEYGPKRTIWHLDRIVWKILRCFDASNVPIG